MASLAINDVWLLKGITLGPPGSTTQVAYTNMTWRVTNITGGSATDNQLAVQMNSILAGLFKALLCNPATWRGLMVHRLFPLPAPVTTWDTTGAGAGTAGAIPMAKQTAGLLSSFSLLSGPSQRGRLYIPFPSTSDTLATGNPSVGYQTRLLSLATQLGVPQTINGAGTAIIQSCLWHKATQTSSLILGWSESGKWATQKRRGDFGKQNVSPI